MSRTSDDTRGILAFVPNRDLVYLDEQEQPVELFAEVAYLTPHSLDPREAMELAKLGEGKCL